MNRLLKLLLLFVMSFSIAHEVVVSSHTESHCSAKEYVAEFSAPIQHDGEHEHENDVCDTHFMFHLSSLLSPLFSLFEIEQDNFQHYFQITFLCYSHVNNTFRPPIV